MEGAEGGLQPGVGEDIERDHRMDEDDDMRPHMNLKRHASAGTLHVQSKAAASVSKTKRSHSNWSCVRLDGLLIVPLHRFRPNILTQAEKTLIQQRPHLEPRGRTREGISAGKVQTWH